MKFFALAVGAAALPLAAGLPSSRGWCGTTEPGPSDSILQDLASLQALESASFPADASVELSGGNAKLLRARDVQQVGSTTKANLTIPFYMHVVSSEGKTDLLTDAVINAQLRVMEEAFAPFGIFFDIRNVFRYVDNDLAVGPYSAPDFQAFDDFLRRVRQGGYDTLNNFIYTDFSPWLLGACSLPESGKTNAGINEIFDDACHVASGTVPGGDIANFNLGYTLVHEVGHWLGLLHPFSGFSCTGPGDFVDDTPVQSTATSGCPVGKDSCVNQPGLDAITNYMDYSDDSCYTEFSAGQTARMVNSYNVFRRRS